MMINGPPLTPYLAKFFMLPIERSRKQSARADKRLSMNAELDPVMFYQVQYTYVLVAG